MTKLIVWTRAYAPFTMGGSCHHLLMTELEVGPKIHLGKSFYGHLIEGPNGLTKVAEAESGAIIGDTIEMVKKDIKACKDKAMMREQIEAAKKEKQTKDGRVTTPEDWWVRMGRARQ